MTGTLCLPARIEGPALLTLRRDLLAALHTGPDLVLVCSAVERLSPPGQALLVLVRRTAQRRGGHLHLVDPSPQVLAALRASRLTHLLASPAPARA